MAAAAAGVGEKWKAAPAPSLTIQSIRVNTDLRGRHDGQTGAACTSCTSTRNLYRLQDGNFFCVLLYFYTGYFLVMMMLLMTLMAIYVVVMS